MVKMLNFMMCIFYYNLKKSKSIVEVGKKDRVKIDGCQVTLKHFGLICYEESFYEALD